VGDEGLAPYTTEFVKDRFGGCLQVLREEVVRIREEAGGTEWREEEAKKITVG